MRDIKDNLTQTRGSLEKKKTFFGKIKALICPCIVSNGNQQQIQINSVIETSKAAQERNSYGYFKNNKKSDFTIQQASKVHKYRKTSDHLGNINLRKELIEHEYRKTKHSNQRQTMNLQSMRIKNAASKSFSNQTIFNYAENQLISIGINESHLLAKISSVRLNPNIQILKKELSLPTKNNKEKESSYAGEEFQEFWKERYIYFQKFDEGIKVDEHSWANILPEKIAEYISLKCSGAKVILDGFAGIGGASLKFASLYSCVKMIANDNNGQKLSLLINNAKVYEVDSAIELSQSKFLQLQKRNIDVVYVQPPLNKMQNITCKSLSIVDFQPTLDKVIIKSLKLAPNIIMLLPPDINIQILCSCINKCASELKVIKNSCSIKIQKIYFQQQFKYILMTIGSLLNKDIKLNEELQIIYSKLKNNDDSFFKYKKIIKKLRQQHGMIEVFNLLKNSQKIAQGKKLGKDPLQKKPLIDIFFGLIIQKNLMPKQKLDKLIQEQKELKKSDSLLTNQIKENQHEITLEAVMEQQKVEESNLHYRQTQQTQSQYSHYSYLSGVDKSPNNSQQSRLIRQNSDSFNSVIIKRTLNNSRQKGQNSISHNSPPKTPTRKPPRNRATQIHERNPQEDKRKRAEDLS